MYTHTYIYIGNDECVWGGWSRTENWNSITMRVEERKKGVHMTGNEF